MENAVQEDVKMADLFTGQPVPVDEKVAVLKREVAMRRRVYPNLVARGTMKQAAADRGIEVMLAILDDYERQRVQTFKTAPQDGTTILVQNAGGFGCPALVCWCDGQWLQVDYQGTVWSDAVAVLSFDSWTIAQ